MTKRFASTVVAVCFSIAAISTAGYSQQVPPEGMVDSAIVSVDFVNAEAGATVSVPIRIANNEHVIAGFIVPIRYDASILTYDTLDLSGSVVTSDFIMAIHSEPDSNYLWVTCLPDFNLPDVVPIVAESGVLATLVFTVNPSAPVGLTSIDSLFEEQYIGPYLVQTRVAISDTLALYFPQFVSGGVYVELPTDVNTNDGSGLPTRFDLAQNYPNPFNPTTNIDFSLPTADHVILQVFNVLGQRVETLVDKNLPAGRYQVEFDASAKPSGVYFYRLTAGQSVSTRKMILLK